MRLENSEIKKIAVFRALQLGDMLCAVPALRALRKAFPYATITLIGLPWAASFVKRFSHYLDLFIRFPGYPGLPEQTVNQKEVIQFLTNIQKERFDLVLQMQGDGSIVNSMIALFNTKYISGFYKKNNYCPDADLFFEYPDQVAEIDRHLLLMNYIGIPSGNRSLEFPLNKKDREDFQSLNLPYLADHYICIHPGSRRIFRQWPPEYFAMLADYCLINGMPVVITGSKEEEEIAETMIRYMEHKAFNATGKTTLGAVGTLINNAYALICNCTGVSHIAAALKTPSIVINMDGEPERWAPLDTGFHHTIDWKKNPDFDLVFNALAHLLQSPAAIT